MYAMDIMDMAILYYIAAFMARLQIIVNPPYNTSAKDWKYNNDYVDGNDTYRHSKWLSMMEKRLKLAKKLLNPQDSVLIVTIDEKEYLHLGCLLEEMFSNETIQMISTVINPKGTARTNEFSRVNEFINFVMIGHDILPHTGSDMLMQDVSDDTNVIWRRIPMRLSLTWCYSRRTTNV